MLHTVAIIIHAASATAAFIVGIFLILQRNMFRQLQLSVAFLALLILMEVFLITAILAHVASLPLITQIVFAGLAGLGLYMIWRAVQAWSVLREQRGDPEAVVDHVGFNLIALFDGFAIVAALDLQAPGWLVAVIAVAAVAVGIYAINMRKKTVAV
jgi:hypothetical protein